MKYLIAFLMVCLPAFAQNITNVFSGQNIVSGQHFSTIPSAGGGSSLNVGLVTYWTLNESSGNRADSVGANTLKPNGGVVASASGILNNAASGFDVSSTSLTNGSPTGISFGPGSMTISVWVYFTDKTQDPQYILDKSQDSTHREYWLVWRSAGQFRFYIFAPDGSVVGEEDYSFSASNNTWYNVIAWYDSGNSTVNVTVNNGTMGSSGTSGTFAGDLGVPFYLGNDPSGAFPFAGRIDENGLWNRILTPTEKTTLQIPPVLP